MLFLKPSSRTVPGAVIFTDPFLAKIITLDQRLTVGTFFKSLNLTIFPFCKFLVAA